MEPLGRGAGLGWATREPALSPPLSEGRGSPSTVQTRPMLGTDSHGLNFGHATGALAQIQIRSKISQISFDVAKNFNNDSSSQ